MKTLIAIPARFHSTRFPGKPLALIHGRPMLEWVIDGVRKSKKNFDIVVLSDNQKVLELASRKNTVGLLTSEDCPTGTDRIYEGLLQLEKKGKVYDFVINVQGDEPLINESIIDPLIDKAFDNPNVNMFTFGHALTAEDLQNKNCVKVVINQKNEAIYFSRFPIPFSRLEYSLFDINELNKKILKHVGVYGYSTRFLKLFCETAPTLIEKAESLEQLRALDLGEKIYLIKTEQILFGVDTLDDLIKIETREKK